jgi:FMN reductase
VTATRLVVVSAGVGQPSSTRLLADRLATATEAALSDAGRSVSVEVIELRTLVRDLTTTTLTGVGGPELRAALATVSDADAIIAVTPVYNASYSGLFKMFVDSLEPGAIAGRPVLLGATGGTPRHALALEFAVRPLFAHLRASTAPIAVFAAPEDWASAAGELAERMASAGAGLAQLVIGRPATRASDPYAYPLPFAQLLAPS